jgi:hypothetical protein
LSARHPAAAAGFEICFHARHRQRWRALLFFRHVTVTQHVTACFYGSKCRCIRVRESASRKVTCSERSEKSLMRQAVNEIAGCGAWSRGRSTSVVALSSYLQNPSQVFRCAIRREGFAALIQPLAKIRSARASSNCRPRSHTVSVQSRDLVRMPCACLCPVSNLLWRPQLSRGSNSSLRTRLIGKMGTGKHAGCPRTLLGKKCARR